MCILKSTMSIHRSPNNPVSQAIYILYQAYYTLELCNEYIMPGFFGVELVCSIKG